MILFRFKIQFLVFLLIFVACEKKNIKKQTDWASMTKMERLEKVVEDSPSYNNFVNLGLEHAANKNFNLAIETYNKAIEINKDAPLAWNNLCVAYNELKRFAKAIASCQKAIDREPSFQLAKNNLKYAKDQLSLEKNKLGNKSTEGKSDNEIIELGLAFYASENHAEAIKVWKLISNKSNLFGLAQNNIASSYILLKKLGDAEKHLQMALSNDPKNANFLANKKWLESLK